MKKILQTLLAVVISITAQAQAPLGIPYQAAARNANGNIMANQAINVRFTIHDSIANGTSVYQETHSTTTNAQGMFSLNMGLGTPTTGSFNQINWGNNAKFMQVELSTNGGTNYTDMGTQQMMSVPYAMYAKKAESIKLSVSQTGDTLFSGGGNYVIVPGISYSNINPNNISIGSSYGGGIIAYIFQPNDLGFDPNVVHGLIAAPSDQSTGAEWGCFGTAISGADGTVIGTGNQNTIDIMNGCSQAGIAARICGDLVLNGYSDWYLPSIDELAKLYQNRNAIGGFVSGYYWSSSEYANAYSWFLNFNSGNSGDYSKVNLTNVRAVRSF